MKQKDLFGDLIFRGNLKDEVYTPDIIAKEMVDIFKPCGKILEPCKGNGVFMRYLPKDTEWCEIKLGKDFFNYKDNVDWIITNPPYSCYDKFLEHCFEIANNIVLLVPLNKIFNSWERIEKYKKFGGIKEIWLIGTGNKCGFPFGFPCGAFYFKRGYKWNNIKISFRKTNSKESLNKREEERRLNDTKDNKSEINSQENCKRESQIMPEESSGRKESLPDTSNSIKDLIDKDYAK